MSHSPRQREFWNGQAGEQWVRRNDVLDAMLAPMTAPTMDALTAAPGSNVLDIGCGAGETTMLLAQRGLKPLGVDISAPLVALAKQRATAAGSPARFMEADAGATTVPGAPFDALFSRFGVMFFEDPQAAFTHLHAQMKRDAPMAFVCWRSVAENSWNLIPMQAVLPLLPQAPPPPDPHAPGPMAFADADRTTRILSAAGWQGVRFTRWDGELVIGNDLEETADFMGGMAVQRLVAGLSIDPAEIRKRVVDGLRPLAGADGVLRAPAACWIVIGRA
jgi:SAM-dependent methyltransferase